MISNLGPEPHKRRGCHLQTKHRALADEYLANGLNASGAARTVGYKNPGPMAAKIFNRPEVRRYLEARLAELQEAQYLRRAELLAKMKRLNDFNLMHSAAQSKKGMLEISAERYAEVAEEIGDCVTEVEFTTYENEDGSTETRVRIKLMDKDKMFDRELQYHGLLVPPDVNINIGEGKQSIDFDQLCTPPNGEDVVEGKIKGK